MTDLTAAVARMRGMLTTPEATLTDHLSPIPPWMVVAREHTLPLLVGSALVSILLLVLIPPPGGPGDGPSVVDITSLVVVRIFVNFVLLMIMAGVLGFFAGLFQGSSNFNAAYVLTALSMTPLYLGEAVLPVPLLGPMAAMAGLVYSIIILYKGVPHALSVPQTARGRHFLMSMVLLFVIWVLSGLMLGPYLMPEAG